MVFSFCFCATILISFAMLVVCAVYQKMLLWTELVFTVTWGMFTAFFTYCIKNKWWFFPSPIFGQKLAG